MKINNYIDHTNLKPETNQNDIEKLCNEAIKYDFFSVCINPCWINFAKSILVHKNIKICTVIGFPLGANTTYIKLKETEEALKNGADEIDMVINIGFLKSAKFKEVYNEIKEIKNICKNNILKVIVETCLLTQEEKINICKLVIDSGADIIKTSTGFNKSGADINDIILFNNISNGRIGIKASGGIKDYNTALSMINAGATRIGTSNSILIVESPLNN